MFDTNYQFTCTERFLRYVKIDTQSDEESTTFPSSAKQLDLSKILVEELKEVGLEDVHMEITVMCWPLFRLIPTRTCR